MLLIPTKHVGSGESFGFSTSQFKNIIIGFLSPNVLKVDRSNIFGINQKSRSQ